MDDRATLVRERVKATGAFAESTVHAATEPGRDPFYAVVATTE